MYVHYSNARAPQSEDHNTINISALQEKGGITLLCTSLVTSMLLLMSLGSEAVPISP